MAFTEPSADEAAAVDHVEESESLASLAPAAPSLSDEWVSTASSGVESTESPVEIGGIPERHWYVIHTYSGYENKVQKNLLHRIETMGMQDLIFSVVVPVEEEVEMRGGKRATLQRKIYPGYVLVDMILSDQSWYVVRNTPGVTGFVGSGNKPVPLEEREVQAILRRMEADAPKIKVSFIAGQTVKIIEGPFAEFTGTVDGIYAEKGKVKVLVSFFGRETPIELDFLQIERI